MFTFLKRKWPWMRKSHVSQLLQFQRQEFEKRVIVVSGPDECPFLNDGGCMPLVDKEDGCLSCEDGFLLCLGENSSPSVFHETCPLLGGYIVIVAKK